MKNPQNKNRASLITGPVHNTLINLTVPMIFGIISILIFNFVDTLFIGQLGTKELAAVSFTFPITFIIISLSMGLGVGVSAVISRAIGEGNHEHVKRLTTDGLAFSFFCIMAIAILGLLTIEPLFQLLGATETVMPHIKQYMFIIYPSMVLLVIPMVGNSAIRATGDTKTPSIIMMISTGINIILDPILIFGLFGFPRLEIMGAAIATAISWGFILFVSLWVLGIREKMLTIVLPKLYELISSWKKILYIGLPAAATNMLVPICTAIVTRMISQYGPEAVAGFGVGSRIESLALVVIFALASILVPFIGQNWGAGKESRVQQAIKYSLIFSLIWGAFVILILGFSGKLIGSIFSNSETVIEVVGLFMWIFPLSYGALGVIMCVSAAFNALHEPAYALLITIVRLFVLYIPLAYFGAVLLGIKGIFMGGSLATILASILAFYWIRQKFLHQDIEPVDSPIPGVIG